MTLSSESKKAWTDLINESVHTSDDVDIGDIDAVSRDFVVVKRGFVNIHYYYIPIGKVEGWDGSVLWLKISEGDVKRSYERDKIPDPTRYYVKDYPYYVPAYYPSLATIPPRYRPAAYPNTSSSPPSGEAPRIYKCDLCDVSFRTEDEFSNHVQSQH